MLIKNAYIQYCIFISFLHNLITIKLIITKIAFYRVDPQAHVSLVSCYGERRRVFFLDLLFYCYLLQNSKAIAKILNLVLLYRTFFNVKIN